MALFWPIVMDEEPCAAMVGTANDILDGVGYGEGDEPWLPVGIGLDFGRAYVVNIGGGEARATSRRSGMSSTPQRGTVDASAPHFFVWRVDEMHQARHLPFRALA